MLGCHELSSHTATNPPSPPLTGILSMSDLTKLPKSELLNLPFDLYTLSSLGGRVMCNVTSDTNQSTSYSFTGETTGTSGGTKGYSKPLCFVTWGNSINAQIGLPIMYSLSTNPRATQHSRDREMFLCDCAIDQSDFSQKYCNGEKGPNMGECHTFGVTTAPAACV